jgi:hypothetical protein
MMFRTHLNLCPLEYLQQFSTRLSHPFFLAKWEKNLSNSLASSLSIFPNLAKIYPERASGISWPV